MEVNKKRLSDIFGVSVRTIQNWQDQGMPVARGGGKGNEVLYDSAAAIEWYSARDAEIENEKLRKEVEDLRIASESDLQPGTIEYERHRLTRAQADAQELKNAKDTAEVVETAFCTFVLSRIAGEIASILDGIPLSVQRRFPELENRHIDFLKKDIIKAMNKAAALDEIIPGLLSEYIEQSGYGGVGGAEHRGIAWAELRQTKLAGCIQCGRSYHRHVTGWLLLHWPLVVKYCKHSEHTGCFSASLFGESEEIRSRSGISQSC